MHLAVTIAAKKYPSYLLEELFVISKMLATFVVGYYLFRSNNSQTTRCQKTWGQGNVEICLKRRRNDYTVFVKSYGYLYSTYILYLHMCMNLHMHTVEAQNFWALTKGLGKDLVFHLRLCLFFAVTVSPVLLLWCCKVTQLQDTDTEVKLRFIAGLQWMEVKWRWGEEQIMASRNWGLMGDESPLFKF